MSEDVLDLDALAPQPRKMLLFGQEVIVKPPSTQQVLELASMGKKLQGFADAEPAQMLELLNDFQAAIAGVIPEIKDKPLTPGQLSAIAELVVEMGMPKESKELAKRGITPDDPKAPQS